MNNHAIRFGERAARGSGIFTSGCDGQSVMRHFRTALFLSACAYMPNGAFAQTSDQQAMDQVEARGGLQEIVVTAQRREESSQDIPIAVNAFSSETVENKRIQDISSLSTSVPGFSISTFSKSRLNPSLRGGSSSLASAGAEQAVGLFIDDQYFGGAGDFEIDLFDVERIEVLRGPQGTLFGRNTTGGSINVVTRKPSDFFEGKVEATVGNYDTLELRGMLTGPLSDNLSALIAVTSRDRKGTSLNLTTGNRLDDTNRSSFRAKLMWEPTPDLEIIAGLGFSRASEAGVARDLILPEGVPISNTDLIAAGFMPDDDPRVVQNLTDGSYDSTQWTANLRITKQFENFSLLSVSTYRDFKADEGKNSNHGAPAIAFEFGESRATKAFSQELRFVSEFEGPFNLVGGLYFFASDEDRYPEVTSQYNANTFIATFQSAVFCPLQDPADTDAGIVTPACQTAYPSLFTPNDFSIVENNKTTSYSAFVDGTYDVNEWLTLLGGIRYTHDKKKFSATIGGDPDVFWNPPTSSDVDPVTGIALVGQSVEAEDDWGEVTYRVGFQIRPAEEIMLYGTRATGFRSGVFDATQSDPALVGQAVDPETVVSHEIGLKSRFLDNRIQFNLAAFHAKYENLQFFVNTGQNVVTTNAGSARVQGIEVDLTAAVTDELTLSAIYSYQDGTSSGIPVEAEIAPGTPPAGTIPHTLILGVDYEHEFANGSAFYLSGDFTHKARYNLEFTDTEQFFSKTDALINARIGFRTADDWDFSIWGQNLTNENIVQYGQDFWFFFYDGPTAFANPEVFTEASMPRYQPPRTYGVTLRKSF